jgi:multidrug efflux system membrane fusion protein
LARLGKPLTVIGGLGVALLFAALIMGLMLRSEAKQGPETENAPLVRVQSVNLAGEDQSYTYSGTVKGRYETNLAFQAGGKIISRNVNLGSLVKAGDLLMRIDPVDIERGVESSKAQVMAAESQYRLAKDNLERSERLRQEGLISQADYDRAKTAYDSALAQIRQAKAQAANSQSLLGYCNLSADHAGVVAGIYAEIGQVVGAGQPVVAIVQDNEKEVEVNVPENRLDKLRPAQILHVKFWALPNVAVTGRVRQIAPMADPVSRTYSVRISLINPPAAIKLGMTASVLVADPSKAGTVYIPLTAVYQTGQTPAVWVVNAGKVSLRTVRIGEFGMDQVQVLGGLNQGELVVTAGIHKLREGQTVRIGDDAR